MKTLFARLLSCVCLLAVGLVVARCKGDAGGAGPTGPTGSTGPTGPTGLTGATGPAAAFKSTTGGGGAIPSAAGVTSLMSLTFTAPAAGYAAISATGYCAVPAGSTPVEWTYVIGTSATEGWSSPQPAADFATGSTAPLLPLAVDRVFPVVAGANTFYLNVQTYQTSSLSFCVARMIAFYSSSLLP